MPKNPDRFISAPLCDGCWDRGNPEHPPARLVPATRVAEQCVMCGDPTLSGIYQRVRASEVFYLPPAER